MTSSTSDSDIDLSGITLDDPQLSRLLRDRFLREGFLRIDRLAGDSDLEEIDLIYDRVVNRRHGRGVERFVAHARGGFDGSVVTIVAPEADEPALMQTALVRRARALLMNLFAVETDADLVIDCRLFFKPPESDGTPWHQDAANRPRPHNGGSVWIALDDATDESGSLLYMPGSHRGELLKHSFDADHFHVDPPENVDAVAAPVARGGAIAHHCMTLHCSTSNRTNRARRALVVVAQLRRLSDAAPGSITRSTE